MDDSPLHQIFSPSSKIFSLSPLSLSNIPLYAVGFAPGWYSFADESAILNKLTKSWHVASGDADLSLKDGSTLSIMKHANLLVAPLLLRPKSNMAAQPLFVFLFNMLACDVRHTGFTKTGEVVPGIEDAKKDAVGEVYELLEGSSGVPTAEELTDVRAGEMEIDRLLRLVGNVTRNMLAKCVALEEADAKRRRYNNASGGNHGTQGGGGSHANRSVQPQKDVSGAVSELFNQIGQLRKDMRAGPAGGRGGGSGWDQGRQQGPPPPRPPNQGGYRGPPNGRP